jgi:GNAT superfamily N-acetyltransferase
MNTDITIRKATADYTQSLAVLVGELLAEITHAIGHQAFNFNLEETFSRLKDFIDQEKYFVFAAFNNNEDPIGIITLYEGYALYTEGIFGTIPELYVKPEYRSTGVGFQLVSQAKSFGQSKGWKRLEVSTPPLPQFEKTLAFYEREGFAITGGRKLKIEL